MGKANRQRRTSKEKARKKASPSSPPRVGQAFFVPAGQPTPRDLVTTMVAVAMDALATDNQAAFEHQVATLNERQGSPGWRRLTHEIIEGYLQQVVTTLWQSGWQPVDVDRVANRRLTPQHRRLVRDAIATELQAYPATTIDPTWSSQLSEIDARVWWPSAMSPLRARIERSGTDPEAIVRDALEVLFFLSALPPVELLCPIPGSVTAGRTRGTEVDDRVLSRVRALLAKAESTTFPAEAETFTAGAQALMARHSIDQALLAATATDSAEEPLGRRIGIDNPYEEAKALLLQAVSQANRCRMVWSRNLGHATVVGFRSDVDGVDALFTSLLIQGTRAMTQAGSRTDSGGRSRTRSFRQSFLIAYAARIGERLEKTREAQTTKAAASRGGQNLLPVLAARDHQVDAATSALFADMTHHAVGLGRDREGWHRGRTAADLAVLQVGAPLPV